jgi:hypothetical protein
MRHRTTTRLLLLTVSGLLLAAWLPGTAGAVSFVDKQVQAGALLLQNYVNASGQQHHFIYPTKAMVKKGGGLTAPIWPANPWTGKIMAPGTGRGTYTYTPNADRTRYTLTAHLSKGSYKLTGGIPGWFKVERDTAAKQGALLLQRYVEEYASLHGNVFPAATDVTPAVVGAGYTWPQDPWTGAAMVAGTALGDFSYTQLTGGTSYSLRVKLTTGWSTTFGPSGVAAAWSATADAGNDQIAQLGVRILKGYIAEWGLLNNATPPTAAALTAGGSVGAAHDFWPADPFTGAPMAPGADPGAFSYSPGASGDYSLGVHDSEGTHDLSGTVPQQLRTASNTLKSALTNADIRIVQSGVDRYALDHAGLFPANASAATLDSYVDPWPINPWTNAAMATGSTTQGDCDYATSVGGYTITAYVADAAAGDSVDDFWSNREMVMRDHLKNMSSQADVQALKEYVDEWKAAHTGTPPTTDELTKAGATGVLHSWWPVNPWTNEAMVNHDGIGDFQYAPGTGGSYTLTVRQYSDAYFTEYYAAQ